MPSNALTRFLGPAGPGRTLVQAQFITALGNGFFLTCFTLYATRILGLSPAELGLGLSIGAIVGMFAGVPFGHLADQRGPRGVAVWLHVGTGVTFGAILFVSWFPLFVVAVCLYLLMYRGGNAAKAALIVGVLDGPALVATRARIQAANNLGMSMGAAMAAIVLQIDTRSAYVSTLLFDALTFAVCGLFFLRLPKVARSAPRAAGEPRLKVLRDRPYAVVSLINAVMLAHAPMLEVILPLWVVLHTDAPRGIVSALVVINTAAVVFLQVRISEPVDNLQRSVRAFRNAGFVLGAACVAYASVGGGRPVGGGHPVAAGHGPARAGRDDPLGRFVGGRLRARAVGPAGPVPGPVQHRSGDEPDSGPGGPDSPADRGRRRRLAGPRRGVRDHRSVDAACRAMGRAYAAGVRHDPRAECRRRSLVKIEDFHGIRVAKCDVEEALEDRWRTAADEIDVVRVSAPPPEAWAGLREAGFVCKPKLIRWYAAVGADDADYRSRMSRKDRWNLRNAERAAEEAGLTTEVVGPIGAELMDEFLVLYEQRVAEMRRGLNVAGGMRDDVIGNESFHSVVMRNPGGDLAGMIIGRVSFEVGAFRVNVSAVTEHWRRASLTRVMYARGSRLARELGLPRLCAGTDPNLFGFIAEPGLYSFKARLGFKPTAPELYSPGEAEHEADLVLRLDRLSDPSLLVGYLPDGGDDDLVLHVFGSDPATDLRVYSPGLAHAPVFHQIGQVAAAG